VATTDLTWDEEEELAEEREEWRSRTARCATKAGGRTKVCPYNNENN